MMRCVFLHLLLFWGLKNSLENFFSSNGQVNLPITLPNVMFWRDFPTFTFSSKIQLQMFWFANLLDFCWIWIPLLSSRRRLMEKCCCIKHGVELEVYQLGQLAINRWFHGFLLQLWWKLTSAKCWISKWLTLHCNLHILRAIWTIFVTPWCFDFYNLADSEPGQCTRASGYRK